MVKEFYSNLAFDNKELLAISLLKGRKIKFTQELLDHVLGFPNEGIEQYYSHREVPYEGYSRERAVCNLVEGKSDTMGVSNMNVSNWVLLPAINQMVISRARKSNIQTFL